MDVPMLRWRLHRMAVDRLGYFRPFKRDPELRRVLFISERDPICHAQLFPFYYYRRQFSSEYGIEFRELPLARFLSGEGACRERVDAVCFQSWFDLTPGALREIAAKLLSAFPGARLGYFDWFAPTDLRYAEALDGTISVYLKKQLLKDWSQYGKTVLGDTNLTDYYARRFELEYPSNQSIVPTSFRDKVLLGTHFGFSSQVLRHLQPSFPAERRDIDLHARLAVGGVEWYRRMRQESLDRALALKGRLNVACEGRVSHGEYWKELFRSKLCFSPFGYGEVCWRDFEAMAAGALLLKPDMSHVKCYPDLFVPHETYVPLAWDLGDFTEKVEHYLARPQEREAIARRAFDLLQGYVRRHCFMRDIGPLLARLGLNRVPGGNVERRPSESEDRTQRCPSQGSDDQ